MNARSSYLWLCGASVSLGALLLFSVQPVLAKMILPWFGGSAGVWSVCLLFFQTLLLGGYGYAHCLARFATPRVQAIVHIGLLGVSLLALPILPNIAWKPAGDEEPLWRILGLLLLTAGAPFLLLSATSPLVQTWYARQRRAGLPYRLFALSNLASLAALLAYPVAVEPFTTSRQQALVWSGGYAAFAALMTAAAWRGTRATAPDATVCEASPASGVRTRAWWLLLAAVPSSLLLGVTNHICQNVASIPFLWIAPLAAYLLSFILCFDRESVHRWRAWTWLGGAGLAGMSWAQLQGQLAVRIAVPLFVAGLFAVCMFCHARLAERKPAVSHLTSYYLMISLGGALGSLLVGIVAPQVMRGFFELPIGVAVCALVLLFSDYRKHWITDAAWASVAVFAVAGAGASILAYGAGARVAGRNFYGVLRVNESGSAVTLVHGSVNHGSQDLKRPAEPTTYYTRASGAGLAIESLKHTGRRIGVVGLGAGTLAAYARERDVFRFYEINPLVVEYARTQFRYLSDCPGAVEIVLGDGRLALEREIPQGYDLLAIDAFSGDSIPVHLLSREAFDAYLRHLKPEGILAFHVSNLHLSLAPVVERTARSMGLVARRVVTMQQVEPLSSLSDWVLVSRSGQPFERTPLDAAAKQMAASSLRPWTDNYSN